MQNNDHHVTLGPGVVPQFFFSAFSAKPGLLGRKAEHPPDCSGQVSLAPSPAAHDNQRKTVEVWNQQDNASPNWGWYPLVMSKHFLPSPLSRGSLAVFCAWGLTCS